MSSKFLHSVCVCVYTNKCFHSLFKQVCVAFEDTLETLKQHGLLNIEWFKHNTKSRNPCRKLGFIFWRTCKSKWAANFGSIQIVVYQWINKSKIRIFLSRSEI